LGAQGEYTSNVQRVKTALAEQQSAIGNLIKKELDIGAGNKLVYAHSLPPAAEDKFLIGNGSSSGCCLQPRPGPNHQGYGYANGECGSTLGSVLHSKNSLNATGRQEVASSALQTLSDAEADCSNSIVEEEERRNDVPALKSQFQVGCACFPNLRFLSLPLSSSLFLPLPPSPGPPLFVRANFERTCSPAQH
jgi:hypothetical protein